MIVMTVEKVRYAIGSVCTRVLSGKLWNIENDSYLDAHSEKTEDLYLMLWYQLRECNQYTDEECHLTMILHVVPDEAESAVNTK